MPIYEYACENCGTRFERFQSIHDEPIRQCPNCGNLAVHKVFHPAGIIFKGSGWYITDSRKSSSGVTSESKTGSTDAASKEVADSTTPSGEKKTPPAETKKVAAPPTPRGKKTETQ